jgi:hypothetical protein
VSGQTRDAVRSRHRTARASGAGFGAAPARERIDLQSVQGFMPRANRSVAGFCIALVVLSAFLPGVCAFDCALLEPCWILLPNATPVAVCIAVTPGNEQPLSFLSLLASRAPPSPALS